MSRMSFQPSHLEYKDRGESSSCAFTRLYAPQNVMSSSTSALYLIVRMKKGPTEYDRVILEVF